MYSSWPRTLSLRCNTRLRIYAEAKRTSMRVKAHVTVKICTEDGSFPLHMYIMYMYTHAFIPVGAKCHAHAQLKSARIACLEHSQNRCPIEHEHKDSLSSSHWVYRSITYAPIYKQPPPKKEKKIPPQKPYSTCHVQLAIAHSAADLWVLPLGFCASSDYLLPPPFLPS